MRANPVVDDSKALAFLDDDDFAGASGMGGTSKRDKINMMKSQKALLRSILMIDSAENGREHRRQN